MTIIEFLEARIAEDEAVAREASSRSIEWRSFRGSVYGGTITEPNPEWGDEPDEGYGSITIVYDEGAPRVPEAAHIARHDPTRVLAECAAKRAILAAAEPEGWYDNHAYGGYTDAIDIAVSALAAAYSSHPDYPNQKM